MSEQYSGSWRRSSAWSGVVSAGRYGAPDGEAGIHAVLCDGLSLATIIARNGQVKQASAMLAEIMGCPPPVAPKIARGSKADLVWSGDCQWLLVSDQSDIVPQAAQRLSDCAAVSDQSDARAILQISGRYARHALAKGCMIDLHPRVFQPGDAALTSIEHIGVQMWQLDDEPTYRIAVARSMIGSFWSWFQASAAEFGLAVSEAKPTGAPL